MRSAALKVFKSRYRLPALVTLADRLAAFADLPGLQVCRRTVLMPQRHAALLRQHPDLTYAVLMPWVDGPTWMEVLLEKRALTPEQCLALARSLADILATMEQRGLAHCDLSGPNVLFPALAQSTIRNPPSAIELVDVEQLYGPGLDRPALLPGGSPGYAHQTAPDGLWTPNADRFAGAVLLAEMLGWCDQRVRDAAWGENYFDPQEMQQETDRYHLLVRVLRERWGDGVAALFEHAWRSDTLSDCATFGEWLVALPERVEGASQITPLGEDVSLLLMQAGRLEREGKTTEALKLYRGVLARLPRGSSLEQEVALIVQALAEREARTKPPGGVTPLVAKGQRLEQEGDLAGALAAYREALAKVPPGSGLREELARIVYDLENRPPVVVSPFVFRGGGEARDVPELVRLCETKPDDAIWHLEGGHFEPWLRAIGRENLAQAAATARQEGESGPDRLRRFLDATDVPHTLGQREEQREPEPPKAARCPHCNKPVQTDYTTCPHCGRALDEVALFIQRTRAGFWRRYIGFAIDLALMVFAIGGIANLLTWSVSKNMADGMTIVVTLIILCLYPILSWKLTGGQTLGQAILGIRVIAANGQPIPWWRAIMRCLSLWVAIVVGACTVGGVLFYLIFWNIFHKPPHDKAAGTEGIVIPGRETVPAVIRLSFKRSMHPLVLASLLVLPGLIGFLVPATVGSMVRSPFLFTSPVASAPTPTATAVVDTEAQATAQAWVRTLPTVHAQATAAARGQITWEPTSTMAPVPIEVPTPIPTQTPTPIPTRTPVPIPLISKSAASMNLQQSDLGAGFALTEELGQDAFRDNDFADGSQRVFESENMYIASTVLVANFVVLDTIPEFMAEVESKLRQKDWGGHMLSFGSVETISLGDRGGIEKFSVGTSDVDGYVLVFIKQNVVVMLLELGPAQQLQADTVKAHARVILDRIW